MSTKALQIISISSALIGSGGVATLSLFDVPMLQSQPASRSLPMIRWLFSRGSHIFPTLSIASSSSFVVLAYKALPAGDRTISSLLKHIGSTGPAGLYLAAAVLAFSMAPFTAFAMIPTNFTLIRRNEELGGARSAESAKHGKVGGRSAEESVDGKDDISQWRDVSVPQEKTKRDSSEEEDKEVKALLDKFGQLNSVRAVLIGAGGVVGLLAALS